MSRTVYVNGDYVAEEDAKVSVFDRGFLFADGVYEVTSVLGGKLIDFDGHAVRLQRSQRPGTCRWRPRSAARTISTTATHTTSAKWGLTVR